MVKERGRAEEPFLADLALERACRQIGMRLSRGRAFDAGGRWDVSRVLLRSRAPKGDWRQATGRQSDGRRKRGVTCSRSREPHNTPRRI